MENNSIGLAQDLMVDILIINVRVRIKRNGYTMYTDNQHHGIITDLLARKWGIGIDKANCTLQYTTQDNMTSYLNPLIRRYRTDLIG